MSTKQALLKACFFTGMLAAAVGLTGCSASMEVAEPLTVKHAGSDADSQMEFWHTLTERKITSNDEAFHAALLLFYGEDESVDFNQRVDHLKERGFIGPDFNGKANEAVRRGTLAVIIANGLDIKRGLLASTFPYSERYAHRELQYNGMYPQGSPQQPLSGGQVVAIVGRMEDYQRAQGIGVGEENEKATATPAARAYALRVGKAPVARTVTASVKQPAAVK